MKATGIVRRIDDLGRVVIPKEIRRTLRIREGDPLEIYTEKDGEVIFKKYSPMGELSSYAAEICESLYKSTGGTVAVCDRDSMIAVSGGGKKELLEKPVSKALEEIMENRRAVRTESGSRAPRPVPPAAGSAAAAPIPVAIVSGDDLSILSRPLPASSPVRVPAAPAPRHTAPAHPLAPGMAIETCSLIGHPVRHPAWA